MKYILDTNIIIRFLANDHGEHSPAAYRLFEGASRGEVILLIDPIVVAECVHVLKGRYYQLSKLEISTHLKRIVEFVQIEADDKNLLISSLEYYAKYNVDYPDAYLASLAEKHRLSVATFNAKDFEKMGVNNYQPS
jgi:predicted nucleic acid-binding protein